MLPVKEDSKSKDVIINRSGQIGKSLRKMKSSTASYKTYATFVVFCKLMVLNC